MLTFKKKGRPIAVIAGGEHNKKLIYLADKADEKDIPKKDPMDYITEDDLRKHKKKMSVVEMLKLKKALEKRRAPKGGDLEDVYNKTIGQYGTSVMKEINIHDGEILPYPSPVKNQTFRHYISGPSGSGKSVWVSKYIDQFVKLYPDREIFIFSDVDEDEVLDKYDPIRIMLDASLYENPIQSEELVDSLVIFDDIDSITDTKVKKAVASLRDSLLKRGRHENISVLVTSHQITNYSDTRVVLNEATSITIFPQSGSSHGIEYVLRKYCGLSKLQIKKVMELPSRWVSVFKNYPMFVVSSKSAYLL